MPRDDDRNRRGRPPGGAGGRGGPPRGKRFDRDDKRSRDDGPRPPRKVGGRAYRKAHGDGPRGDARDDRGAGQRFGGAKSGERSGEKRRYGSKPGGGFRKDGERPRRASDRSERGARTERGDRPKFDRPKFDRPKFDRPREDRPARPAERDRGPRKFDRPSFDRPRSERASGDRPRGDRPFRDRPRGERHQSDRPRDDRPRGDRPYDKRPREGEPSRERPRFSRDRSEHTSSDRPRDARRRDDRTARSSHAWRDHPRSETASPSADRRSERGGNDQEPRREFQQRPAFGGRGAYRERKPETDKRLGRVAAEVPKSTKTGERIAKVVSRAGLASRRDAEEWIVQGRVTVNGRVINSPALDVTANDVIEVDGKPLPERERTRLFLYHKPRGLMTTHADPEGRPTVFDNLPEHLPRVISIGRLDFNTEGLLLLTNDGGLARTLELPETGWLRRYRVRAHGEVTQAQLDQLAEGIEVDGVKYGPIEASLERDQGANVWLVVAIREGKNREVRNVLGHLGLDVNRLIRVSYGPFQLGEIAEGEVQEIKTRVLREQLGEKLIAQAGADFGPAASKSEREPLPAPKPKPKREVVADRKGRRVLVQRTGSDEARARNEDVASGYGPPKRPKRGYHGKRDLKPLDE
jgi:23S rRNA pseudouridine2605 synthase